MVYVKRFPGRFIGGRTITFRGVRWSRTYGLTTRERWDEGRWLGAGSWTLHCRARMARCRYGYRPPWLPERIGRGMTAFSRLFLPTLAGRHARRMRREGIL